MSPALKTIAAVLLLAGGARADKATIDAAKFIDPALPDCGLQKAIDAAAAVKGGAVVTIPAGTFALRRGLVLKDNVEIIGAGMDKTILTPARQVLRLDVVRDSPDADGKAYLKEIPPDLEVGSVVVSCRRYPPGWYGEPRPAEVAAIDAERKTVTLKMPLGIRKMKAGRGLLTFGVTAALAEPVKKGDTKVVLASASLLKPGDEIALGTPDNNSMLTHAFVKAVEGKTVILTRPAQVDFTGWSTKTGNARVNAVVWLTFPMIHQSSPRNAAIRQLTVRGRDSSRVRPMNARYTLSGIHLFNAVNVKIEHVAVRDWPADGFSLQKGRNCLVSHCEATGCVGNGFHSGTGLKVSVFEHCLAKSNGVGLYFCWHNERLRLRANRFIENRGGGITGLGNPGDIQNIIEDNLIAGNGGVGIGINGGKTSGNVIRNNTIENNSQSSPGKHPGIALHAKLEDARSYTITGNTIRDTQQTPTQHVGIEERHMSYRGKPTRADENRIEGNTFAGHKTADIILAGPGTVAKDNGKAKVVGPATTRSTGPSQ